MPTNTIILIAALCLIYILKLLQRKWENILQVAVEEKTAQTKQNVANLLPSVLFSVAFAAVVFVATCLIYKFSSDVNAYRMFTTAVEHTTIDNWLLKILGAIFMGIPNFFDWVFHLRMANHTGDWTTFNELGWQIKYSFVPFLISIVMIAKSFKHAKLLSAMLAVLFILGIAYYHVIIDIDSFGKIVRGEKVVLVELDGSQAQRGEEVEQYIDSLTKDDGDSHSSDQTTRDAPDVYEVIEKVTIKDSKGEEILTPPPKKITATKTKPKKRDIFAPADDDEYQPASRTDDQPSSTGWTWQNIVMLLCSLIAIRVMGSVLLNKKE